jgi:hypothetical protein
MSMNIAVIHYFGLPKLPERSAAKPAGSLAAREQSKPTRPSVVTPPSKALAKARKPERLRINPGTFAHLRLARPIPLPPKPPVSPGDSFAAKVMAAVAAARGEKFDPSTLIAGPPQPPRRMVSGAEIIAAARQAGIL